MGIWWEYHGNMMGLSWKYYGNMMGIWKKHDKSFSVGCCLFLRWKYHGTMMNIHRIFADNWEHPRIGWRHQKSLESSQDPSGPKAIALAGPGKPKWKVDHDLTAMSLEDFHCCNNIRVCPEEQKNFQAPVGRNPWCGYFQVGELFWREQGISGIWM